jgi:hypothetical protein
MTDARGPLTDLDLEAALGDLGRALEWPSTPDLVDAVTARIIGASAGAGRASPLSRWRGLARAWIGGRPLRRGLVLAIVALLAIATVAAALGIGVPGIRILFAPTPTASATVSFAPSGSEPPATPSPPMAPTPLPTEPGFDLGRPVSLADARAGAGFGVLVPTPPALGTPDQVWLSGDPPLARVSLVYGSSASVPTPSLVPGATGATGESLLTEFLGSVDPNGFQKTVGPGTTVEPLTLGGASAYWISGAPHQLAVLYRAVDGSETFETTRVVGNVLIWQVGAVTLRLETTLGRTDALMVADSVR